MAVETTNNRISYSGNGVTTGFSFPYKFLASGDLKVYVRVTATGVETLKTITTHYTVTGAGEDAGGTVTMLVAPAAGETLIIYNDPAATQGVDLVENDAFPAETGEGAWDRAVLLIQRLKDRVDRAVRLSDAFSPAFDPVLPSDLDQAGGLVPVINDDGDGFAPIADWPDAGSVSAAMAAAQAAAEAAQAAAELAEANAETAEANAETAEANAETAEANAETAEANAEIAQAAAEAAATAAQNAAAAVIWNDVVFLTVADSPFTITNAHRGKLLCVDASGGAVAMTLPEISGLSLASPFVLGIKKTDSSGNAVNVSRAGSDTIDGATSKSIAVADAGATFIPDTDPAPDEWTTADFGAQAGNLTIDRFSGDDADTTFTLSVDPGSENNTQVFVEGVYQQKDTYSLSGTTLTFTEAPPLGTDNIEVVIGTVLSIGTPSDSTVTRAKMVAGAVANKVVRSVITTDSPTDADDVLLLSGASFTLTLPTAVGRAGKEFCLVHNGTSITQVYTLNTTSAQTIGGVASGAYVLRTNSEVLKLISDGANWVIVDHKTETDYLAVTVTGAWSANTTYTAFEKRKGNMAHYDVLIALAGAPTSATLSVNLPSGRVIDTAKLASTGDSAIIEGGQVSIRDVGVAINAGHILYNNNSSVLPVVFNAASTYVAAVAITQAVPITFGNTDYINLKFAVPIVGWQP
jgi:hypothetical protein